MSIGLAEETTMSYVTKRLNTLQCALRFAFGRVPTHAEMVAAHARMFGGRK